MHLFFSLFFAQQFSLVSSLCIRLSFNTGKKTDFHFIIWVWFTRQRRRHLNARVWASCSFLQAFLLACERKQVGWLSANHPVLRTLTVIHQLQAPGLQKKCDFGKTKYCSRAEEKLQEQLKKYATRAKTHKRWRADNPLRSWRVHLGFCYIHKENSASYTKKYTSTPQKMTYQGQDGTKKVPEEPKMIHSLLFRKNVSNKNKNIQFSLMRTCTKDVKHEAKKAS